MTAKIRNTYWNDHLPLTNLRKSSKDVCQRCRLCALGQGSKSIVLGNVDEGKANVLFILGSRDPMAARGKLFSSATYEIFSEGLNRSGLRSNDFLITAATACVPTPSEDKPRGFYVEVADKHINACKPRLMHDILRVDPLVVVTLGTNAIKAVFKSKGRPSLEDSVNNVVVSVHNGAYGEIHIPVLLLENPVLVSRFRDDTPEGNETRFYEGMESLGILVRQLIAIRERA